MTKISDNINSYQNLAQYDADMGKEYPNVSYLIDEDEVKWVKDDPLLVVTYNVTSTSSTTKLLDSTGFISYQIIDGVQQQSIQTDYTFDTLGEHIVKYKYSGDRTGTNQFYGCQNVISAKIPDSLTYLTDAFSNCQYLQNVIFGNNVTYMDSTLNNCRRLTSLTISTPTPPTITYYTLYNIPNSVNIYVPAESVEAYKAAQYWSTKASRIQAI